LFADQQSSEPVAMFGRVVSEQGSKAFQPSRVRNHAGIRAALVCDVSVFPFFGCQPRASPHAETP
jgi:hypothetical protein